MSLRRFAIYFLALSAGSTVMFGPCLVGQAAGPDAVQFGAPRDADLGGPMSAETAPLLAAIQARHRARLPEGFPAARRL